VRLSHFHRNAVAEAEKRLATARDHMSAAAERLRFQPDERGVRITVLEDAPRIAMPNDAELKKLMAIDHVVRFRCAMRSKAPGFREGVALNVRFQGHS
jgi:hypothetical protein